MLLRALTDPRPAVLPPLDQPFWLVPLLLLPGEHVRQDLPRLRDALRAQGRLRTLPFLGSWPSWQRALIEELSCLAGRSWPAGAVPRLLHHPLASPLGRRYLGHLAATTGARCQEAAYSLDPLEESLLTQQGPVLPLALAANRLTEALMPSLGEAGAPLLSRPRLLQVVLDRLEALP